MNPVVERCCALDVAQASLVAYLDRLGKTRLTRNLVNRLERLGYQVAIQAT